MKTKLTPDITEENCEGCGNCEGACPINNILEALPDIPEPEKQIVIRSENGTAIVKNEQNCIECERCVNACPTGAIELSDGKLKLETEDCTGCGNCQVTCPVNFHIKDFPFVDDLENEVVVRVEGNKSTVISEYYCVECEECVEKCDNDAMSLVEVEV